MARPPTTASGKTIPRTTLGGRLRALFSSLAFATLLLFVATIFIGVVGALQLLTFWSQLESQRLATQPILSVDYSGQRGSDKRLVLSFTNNGQLPALHARVSSGSGIRSSMQPRELEDFCAGQRDRTAPLTVFPHTGIEHHFDQPVFGPAVVDENTRYYMCGEVTYRDAYSSKHRTPYCFSVNKAELEDPIRLEDKDHMRCTFRGPG